jgi:two-component system sensor histidine kinase KdpD
VITGQLAAALRNRAREAETREREAVVLYDVVRLMADPDVPSSLEAVAGRLRSELALEAVVIDVETPAGVSHGAQTGTAEALAMVRSAARGPARVLREGEAPTARKPGSPGKWIRIVPPRLPSALPGFGKDRLRRVPIGSPQETIGSLILVTPVDAPSLSRADDRLLSAVANQIRLALERARLREEATAAEVLRRTDELRSALLSAVSHDLRTPLSAIVASAGSLLQEDVAWTVDERREFATAIEEEAQRLNRLVGNLLDLSRIEAGSLRPEKGWYDISALIDDVAGHLRSFASRHRLVIEVSGDLPPVSLDYVEIDEVLSNLIENAVKYTPPGTEIRVSARRQGDELQVSVEDSGPGIPPAALPHLFEPFYRVQGSGPQPKGTGLGLAVAAGLVAAHGGRIRAENREGGGARFVFSLPIQEHSKPAQALEQPR